MAVLFEIVTQVVVLSILACLFEYILPQGNLNKSACRAIGILILISVAEPVLALLRR